MLMCVVPSSDSLSEPSRFKAAIRMSLIFFYETKIKQRKELSCCWGLLPEKNIISPEKQSKMLSLSNQTYLRNSVFAPLAHSFAHTDHTLHSLVQSLLDLLQSWNHDDVRYGEGHVDSEDGLLAAAFPMAEGITLTYQGRWGKLSNHNVLMRCLEIRTNSNKTLTAHFTPMTWFVTLTDLTRVRVMKRLHNTKSGGGTKCSSFIKLSWTNQELRSSQANVLC